MACGEIFQAKIGPTNQRPTLSCDGTTIIAKVAFNNLREINEQGSPSRTEWLRLTLVR